MRLKTYFASSVEAAMLLALEHLGPEAMLVNSRKTTPENRHWGEYEVVFVADPEAADAEAAEPPLGGPVGRQSPDGVLENKSVNRMQGEISRLASEIESLGRAMKRAEWKQTVSSFEGEAGDVANSLSEAGFSERFVAELIAGVSPEGGSLRFRALQLLSDRLKSAPSLGLAGHGRKVVALVGPAGVGKSTLIAKLAVRHGVAAKRPCQIVSLDSDRVGGAESMRMVAGVLGVGFRLVEDASMLSAALDSLKDRDLVLIDTPGFARDERDLAGQLGTAMGNRPEIDVHLAVAASMKLRDLERTIRFHSVLNPGKIMFTRLDETEQLGTAIETAVVSGLPVSFLSNGPRVPEDLEPANAAQLVRRALLPMAVGITRGAAA